MKLPPSMLLNIVLATILLTSVFFISTTTSQGAYEYDQWVDLNDDGEINLYDAVMLLTRYGTEGTPINKTGLLLELLDRVDSNEERLDQTRTIRFYEPNETMNDQSTENYSNSAVFVWTPNNSVNNAILSIHTYFEYRADLEVQVLRFGIGNDDDWAPFGTLYAGLTYTWSPIYVVNYFGAGLETFPNQNNYTIRFGFASGTSGVPVYVRNINVLIEVMDGLPAS